MGAQYYLQEPKLGAGVPGPAERPGAGAPALSDRGRLILLPPGDANSGPATRGRFQREPAADEFNPLPHSYQAEMALSGQAAEGALTGASRTAIRYQGIERGINVRVLVLPW